jgi:acetyl-CoA carboxylase biotin carboxyl carrier protein
MTSEKDRTPLIDDARVRSLAQAMKDFDLAELELASPSGERVRLVRAVAPLAVAPVAVAPATAPAIAASPAPSAGTGAASEAKAVPQNVTVVTAPLVGTFYRAAGPDTPSFTEVGQRVRKGQTLCIIEAMKLMNELESEVDGVVIACLTDNGRPVEYGQPLFHIQRS